jgi:hypothetical protein
MQMGVRITTGYLPSGYGGNKNKMKYTIAAIIIIGISGIFIATASASPVISVEPSYLEVSPGEELTVNITVNPNGTEIYGAQYTLHFDNVLLRALSQNKGPFLSQDGKPTNVLKNVIDNSHGELKYGESRIGEVGGVTNPGVLANIRFEVRSSGTSEIRFEEVKLSDPGAQSISNVTLTNGTVEITDSQPSSPFLVYGYVFYGNGSECDNPKVNITNLNTSKEWQAERNESYNYYQLMLSYGIDIVTGEVLQFDVKSLDGSQLNTTAYTITQDDVDNGGLFNFNISLKSPVVPPPGAPDITSWYPVGTEIYNNERDSVTFNITINQTVNVSWLINGTEVFNQSDVNFSEYTNESAVAGYWNVTAYAYNANGSDMHTWWWTVKEINTPPWWDVIPDQTINEDTNLTLNLSEYVHDNETAVEALTLEIAQCDMTNFSHCEINETHYLIAKPKPDWFGLSSGFRVNATDEGGFWNTSNVFYVNVTPVNDAPQIAPIPNQTHKICDSWNVTIDVTDVDTAITADMIITSDPENVTVYNVTTLTLHYTEIVTNKPVTVTVNDSELNDSTTFYVTTYMYDVVINEFEQDPEGGDSGNEWVELYNNGTEPVNISNWKLIDGYYKNEVIISSGAIIPGKGYYTINWTNGALINSKGENITLCDAADSEVDKTLTATDTENDDRCWARVPNGYDTDSDTDWKFQQSTRNASNNIYDVAITSEPNEQETAPNVNAPYMLTVTNHGNVADTIRLNITDNEADFGVLSVDTFALNASEPATAYLNVSDSDVGIYNTTVRATSQGNASVFDEVTVKTNVTALPQAPPVITDWYNNKTEDNSLVITVNVSEWIYFNATANQTIDTWHWFTDGIDQSHNHNNFTTSWDEAGLHNVSVYCENENGSSNVILWNVIVLPYLYGAPPNITAWYPIETEIYDNEGAPRTFNVTINQTVNVSWLINETEVFNQSGVNFSEYTNESAVIGTWNVSAFVKNPNGTDMQTWIWKVIPIEATTISIGDATASPGETSTVLTRIYNATNVGVVDVTLTYNQSVVMVIDVTGGDFDTTIPNLEHNDTGSVRIGAFQTENPGLNDTVTIANITLKAVGGPSSTSPLNISVTEFKDATSEGNDILHVVSNGTFTVNTPPIADAGLDQVVLVNETMQFNASGSYDPDGEIVSYYWDFDDGTNATGVTPTHNYTVNGTFIVTLNVTDNYNAMDEDICNVTAYRNGDANGDGKVELFDAMYLAKSVLEISGFEAIDITSDVNGDGKVTLHDAMYLAKHVLEIPGFEELK